REAILQPIPPIQEQLRQAQYAALLDADDSIDRAYNTSDSRTQVDEVGPASEDEDVQKTAALSDESEEDEGDLYPDEDDEEQVIQTIAHQLEGISNDEPASDCTDTCEDDHDDTDMDDYREAEEDDDSEAEEDDDSEAEEDDDSEIEEDDDSEDSEAEEDEDSEAEEDEQES
ncbi:hypothetical protein EC968_000697, partial [Mortierella alpina]